MVSSAQTALRSPLKLLCRTLLALSPQVPMVIRGPGGVGRQLGAEHSQRLESYFQSIPGACSCHDAPQ